MLAVLRDQHEGQQVRTGTAAGDRVRRRRRLADRLAAAAGELLAHVLDHLPARAARIRGSRSRPRRACGARRRTWGRCRARDRRSARAAGAPAAAGGPACGRRRCGGRSACEVPRSRPRSPPRRPVSSSSASCSSSWAMIVAPRSEDWPYCSRRALASSSFRRSISSRARFVSALCRLGLGSRAARSARIIACAAARSEGSGSKFFTPKSSRPGLILSAP